MTICDMIWLLSTSNHDIDSDEGAAAAARECMQYCTASDLKTLLEEALTSARKVRNEHSQDA